MLRVSPTTAANELLSIIVLRRTHRRWPTTGAFRAVLSIGLALVELVGCSDHDSPPPRAEAGLLPTDAPVGSPVGASGVGARDAFALGDVSIEDSGRASVADGDAVRPRDASFEEAGRTASDSGADALGDASFRDASRATTDTVGDGGCGVPTSFRWSSTGPVLSPVSDATHHLVSIKDPSVVFFNGKWHVFASTVAVGGIYSFAYLSFSDFANTGAATFYYLDQNPALVGYHTAPQVFFFRPQNKWYLIFQSGPPQYSTNADVGDPTGWTRPANFFGAEPAIVTQNKGAGSWLDFKVICDAANCDLFFSDDNGTFYRSQTTIGNFPNGFVDPVIVMKDADAGHLFEASNVYYMKGTGRYLALVEAFDAGSNFKRYYRSWTATSLDGTWTPLQDTFAAPFASTANISFVGPSWTLDISHGEMIRDGYDETLTIDTCHLQYLYQGVNPSAPNDAGYNGIPWQLGLLTRTN